MKHLTQAPRPGARRTGAALLRTATLLPSAMLAMVALSSAPAAHGPRAHDTHVHLHARVAPASVWHAFALHVVAPAAHADRSPEHA